MQDAHGGRNQELIRGAVRLHDVHRADIHHVQSLGTVGVKQQIVWLAENRGVVVQQFAGEDVVASDAVALLTISAEQQVIVSGSGNDREGDVHLDSRNRAV